MIEEWVADLFADGIGVELATGFEESDLWVTATPISREVTFGANRA